MAILNYGNQFRYNGGGYVDSKMEPVESVDKLVTDINTLSLYYTPGMKITVLNDELFGTVDYFLTEDYEWKRLIDFDSLTLSLDKGNYDSDEKEDAFLQLHYTNNNGELVALGNAVDLSDLLTDVENRIEALENESGSDVVDTNTFVQKAEFATEFNGETGLFIVFTYNNGESFAIDITTLKPTVYTQGVGVLIGEGNVIGIDEAWIDSKIAPLNEKIANAENEINVLKEQNTAFTSLLETISGSVTKHEQDINKTNSDLTAAIERISGVETKVDNVAAVAEEAKILAQQSLDNQIEGDEVTTSISDKKVSVLISKQENNAIQVNEDGIFVDRITVTYMDEEINNDETSK